MKTFELIVEPQNLSLGITKVKKIDKKYLDKNRVIMPNGAIVQGTNDEDIINEILRRNRKIMSKSVSK
jgi:hypothetical protein